MANETTGRSPRKILPGHYLYPQILLECKGTVSPVFWPEETKDGWICTCGRENLRDAEACAACGTSREWLRIHFDRTYLAERRMAAEQKEEEVRRDGLRKERRRAVLSKGLRSLLLLAAVLLIAALAVFSAVRWIVPAARLDRAARLRASGEFLRAAEIYETEGRHDLAIACRIDYGKQLSGNADALVLFTDTSPWIRMTGDGVFSVDVEKLETAGIPLDPLIIPDVVDDVLVTGVADLCFMNMETLVSVTFPASVVSIGERCFFKCTSLTGVSLPEGLRTLGERVFINCTALTDLSLPAGITAVPVRLCNNCSSLRSVSFRGDITSVGSYAFSGCSSLSGISLPLTLRRVGDYAFYGCDALAATYAGSKAAFSAVEIGINNEDLLNGLTYLS